MRARRAATALLAAASLLLGLGLAEALLRVAVLGDALPLSTLRQARRYADYFSDDDYWKLEHRFRRDAPVRARAAHPLLGWTGAFDPETLVHRDAGRLAGRRPVLLYGDSFAECVEARCFQDWLAADPEFAAGHQLLNYGVGGYGLDQIHLLLRESVGLYDDPFVLVGLMTLDLDRTALRVRDGPKPWFELEDGALVLRGVPVPADPPRWFAEHPPEIRSYLFRLLAHARPLPARLRAALRGDAERQARKRELGRRLLEATTELLRERELDFAFVIFHPHWRDVATLDGADGWRSELIRSALEAADAPYLWSKDVFARDAAGAAEAAIEHYIAPDNGHPTSHFNALLAREMKRAVLTGQTGRLASRGGSH